jgi:predicted MPP superfamily phosphohydrolase
MEFTPSITCKNNILFYFIRRAYKNTKDIVINKVKINTPLSSGHSPKLNILHLSDLHLENISIPPPQLYEKLKNEPIDLIVLTGDFLDRRRTIPKLVPYLKILNQLHAKHGIYAVLGNHDYVLRQKDLQALIETLEKYNCKVLQNENDMIFVHGKPVNIIGIDEFSTKRSDLEASYKEMKLGINLVLTHDPNIVLHMEKYHFDYLLAGHFHRGQICYPKVYHLVEMGKLAPMNKIKGTIPFISNDLCEEILNIRFGIKRFEINGIL